MTYDDADDLLRLVEYVVSRVAKSPTDTGTVVEWSTTQAMVLFDGSSVAVPVKTFRGVTAAVGHRVGLVKYGNDWAIVGSFNAPPQQMRQVFEASGAFTWTKPDGARQVRVQVLGGGAAGGGAQTAASLQHSCGSGGGAGGYCERIYDASSLPSTVTGSVGAGGNGVTAANGQVGAASRFGVSGEAWYIQAGGGFGGLLAGTSAASFGKEGGEGGNVFGGTPDITIAGGPGHSCFGGDQLGISGAGGQSQMGAGGTGRSAVSAPQSLAGIDADLTSYGGGGGGALTCSGGTQQPGGGGADGCVIVTTTF